MAAKRKNQKPGSLKAQGEIASYQKGETTSYLLQRASERREIKQNMRRLGVKGSRQAMEAFRRTVFPVKKNRKPPSINEKTNNAARSLRDMRRLSTFGKDIESFPYQQINWKRRLAAKQRLQIFCEQYLKPVFYYDWSDDQRRCLEKADRVTVGEGGKLPIAMPRGGGKTSICRAATLRATIYGLRRFIWNIGSTDSSALATLRFITKNLEYNPLLHEDFPELCWPVVCLEGSNRMAASQLFLGQPTHIRLEVDNIIYPTLQLPAEYVDEYWKHDPTSIRFIPEGGIVATGSFTEVKIPQNGRPAHKLLVPTLLDTSGRLVSGCSPIEIRRQGRPGIWVPANSGCILRAAGIDGSIRGASEANPVTLEEIRPDLVLLDDVQKDHKADSPVMCEKLIRLIDGAVVNLSPPGRHIDVLMPGTVIRESDAMDTYLNPEAKPDWDGERCPMVKSWPDGITDFEITQDTPAGKHWNEYAQIRRKVRGQPKTADNPYTNYYRLHRKVMDAGFTVSWKQRYDQRFELSAQQHAMNLRLQQGATFLSEFQNIGRRPAQASDLLITADQLAKKVIDCKRGQMMANHQYVACFLDISNEVFFYEIWASDADFNCTCIEYGTFPEIKAPFFTKDQCESWSQLTALYFDHYPEDKHKAIRTSAGKVRAPLEAKIYEALDVCVPWLLAKTFLRKGTFQREFKIQKLGIDCRWGQASDVVKRFIKEKGYPQIIPTYGQALPATQRQLEEYERREGWFFEDQQHPNVKEPKWVERPNQGDGMYYLMMDVDRLKDFFFARLATPIGHSGSATLYRAPAETHELFSHHVCSSEYPEPVGARGIVKNKWTVREGVIYDNDFLDCGVGAMALLSRLGASIKTIDEEPKRHRRRFSDVRQSKANAASQSLTSARSSAQISRLLLDKKGG